MARGTNKKAQSKPNESKAKSGQTNRNAGATGNGTGGTGGAIEMLKQDHRKVEELFDQFDQADDDRQKEQVVRQICSELIIHTRLKEDIFYPTCRDSGVDEEKLDKSQVAHDGAKVLINDLMHAESDSPYFEAKVSVLREMTKRQAAEEEADDGVLGQAEANDVDEAGLAEELADYRQELQQRRVGRRPARPVTIARPDDFASSMGGEDRYAGDERFRGGNERGYGSRQRYEEDEYEGGYDRSGRRSAGFEGDWNEGRYGASPEQQPPGRRYGEEDRRPRRYDERDEDRRYGRGPGGWFGDSRGHSEASRRGWDERRTDDDGRRRYYAHDEEDHRRRFSGSGHGGWFGDSRGHAEASRRGWQHRR